MRGDREKTGDFQPVSRRILETAPDRAKITTDHQYMPFQLVPKSKTLDDLERSYRKRKS